MKVMISQPMYNKTTGQIRKEREKLVQKLEELGWEVVNTIFEEEPPIKCNARVYFLAKPIEEMSKADVVVFMNGWEKARGVK